MSWAYLAPPLQLNYGSVRYLSRTKEADKPGDGGADHIQE